MDINLKEKNIIFIEESTFLVEGFYTVIENLVKKIYNKELTIYVDQGLDETINNYKLMGDLKTAYLLEGYLDLLDQYFFLKKVKTNGYFQIDDILVEIDKYQPDYLLMIIQKEMAFENFKKLQDHYPDTNFTKYLHHELIEWTSNQKAHNIKAFYLNNDSYVNAKNFQNIQYVYSPKLGFLKLDHQKKFSGGEGTLYGTYHNMLCKVYGEDHLTYVNYKKLERMLKLDIYNEYICWPKDILYYKNDFVGYVMDEVPNALTLEEHRLKNFEAFNVFERFIMCYHLLVNIDYLHKKNILIGDLKIDNILIKSASEVYLIDCGCYQIEDYPCDVCHVEYTKRKLTTEDLKTTLRTVEDEYYPINKILFEILIGKNPNYNPNNTEINSENKNEFYFPLDTSNINKNTPEMILWGALSNRMREFFYYYFKEDKITYMSEWIYELKLFIDTAMKQKERS